MRFKISKSYLILVFFWVSLFIFYFCPICSSEAVMKDFELYYLVGLVDITVGMNTYESVNETDDFPEKVYLEGRAAVYLKGKIQGQYLLTMQLDTGTDTNTSLGKIFKRETDKLYNFDPMKYYPIYGDNSTSENDVNSDGKIYLLFTGEKAELLWGNFRPNWNDTILTAYNRSLYGLKTGVKDDISGVKTFYSQPGTLHSVDKIKIIGHSLYYLKHAQVIRGSEILKLEIKDDTGAIVCTISLQYGRDYQLDYFQGKVVLLRTLTDLVQNPAIINGALLAANEVFLVVEYEFEPTGLIGNATYGFHIYSHENNLQAQGSYIKEKKDGGDTYFLIGGALTYTPSEKMRLNGEWAFSENQPSKINLSNTGGLTYTEIPLIADGGRKGAWSLNIDIPVPDLFPQVTDLRLSGNLHYQEKGFASLTEQAQKDRHVARVGLRGRLFTDYEMESKIMLNRETDGTQVDYTSLRLQRDYQKSFSLTGSLRSQKVVSKNEQDLCDILGGLRINYYVDEDTTYYLSQQLTLLKNGQTPWNNRTTVGADFRLFTNTKLLMDVSAGSLWDIARVNLTSKLKEKNRVHGEWQLEKDYLGGTTTRFSVGNTANLTQKLELNVEHQKSLGTYADSVAGFVGVQYYPAKNWIAGLDYTRSHFHKKRERQFDRYVNIKVDDYTKDLFKEIELADIGLFEREVLSFSATHNTDKIKYLSKVQVSKVNGDAKLLQYLLKNNFRWQVDEYLTLLADVEGSVTRDARLAIEQERSIEGNLSIAYRPIQIDDLNILGKMTYLEHLSPEKQVEATNPDERSRIFSLDWIYDLNEHLQLSQKTAYKSAALRADRTKGTWTYSDTYLWIHRASYDFKNGWGIYGEYRNLWNTLARDAKQGLLCGVNLDVDSNTRLSIGYNFTDFSDDLARLNYRAEGLFLNMVKKW